MTYVNTEGRTQITRAAVSGPGASREDWKILRALAEVLGIPLPYDETVAVRDRMFDISPTLVRHDIVERTSAETAKLGLEQLAARGGNSSVLGTPFGLPIANFYQTDPVSRSSPTMARCTQAFVQSKTPAERKHFAEVNQATEPSV